MTANAGDAEADFEFVIVDRFLEGFVRIRALSAAMSLGLVDLVAKGRAQASDVCAQLGLDPQRAAVLFDLLHAHQVLIAAAGSLELHPDFARALRYRDLLE